MDDKEIRERLERLKSGISLESSYQNDSKDIPTDKQLQERFQNLTGQKIQKKDISIPSESSQYSFNKDYVSFTTSNNQEFDFPLDEIEDILNDASLLSYIDISMGYEDDRRLSVPNTKEAFQNDNMATSDPEVRLISEMIDEIKYQENSRNPKSNSTFVDFNEVVWGATSPSKAKPNILDDEYLDPAVRQLIEQLPKTPTQLPMPKSNSLTLLEQQISSRDLKGETPEILALMEKINSEVVLEKKYSTIEDIMDQKLRERVKNLKDGLFVNDEKNGAGFSTPDLEILGTPPLPVSFKDFLPEKKRRQKRNESDSSDESDSTHSASDESETESGESCNMLMYVADEFEKAAAEVK
ncbi:hypothetical protein HK096_000964, partial [Nowakowskiella sp. JEL0078]